MGDRGASKIQFGYEGTAGTAVAATTIWRGPFAGFNDEGLPVRVQENVGYYSPINRSHIPKLGATLPLPETDATFEQLPHLCEMGLKTVTPSQDGAGDGYIYQYTATTNSKNTIKTYTVEAGDNEEVREMEYCFAETIRLQAAMGEAVRMSATLRGRQLTDAAFTGGLSLPSVEEILASKTKLYVDAIGGTIGSSQVTGSMLGWSLEIATGWVATHNGDGNLYFTSHTLMDEHPKFTLQFTFEHDSNAEGFYDDLRAETARLVRLELEGSAFGTGGTTYSNKTLLIDLAGQFVGIDQMGEQDGNNTMPLTFEAGYDSTAAFFAELLICTDLSALPS